MTSQLRTTAPRDCHCSAQLRPPLKGLPSRATACRYVYTGPGGVNPGGPLQIIEVLHLFRWYTHTHHLSHPTLSHTHAHPPSFFGTRHLSHTTLSHTTLFYFSVLHHLLCLSFLPRPLQHVVLIIGRSCLVGLSGPLV